jgi:hypothetical protein
MGFSRQDATNALQSSQCNEEVALNMLLSAGGSGGGSATNQQNNAGPPPPPPAAKTKSGFFSWGKK